MLNIHLKFETLHYMYQPTLKKLVKKSKCVKFGTSLTHIEIISFQFKLKFGLA